MTVFERLHIVRTSAHALARRGDRVAQLRAARPRRLRGQVVLVDFWTLTCINWLRRSPTSAPGRRPTATTDWSSSASTRRSSRSSTTSTSSGRRRGAGDRLPGRGRQRLRDLERLRQPLLAGALLHRRRRASSATTTSARDATSSRSAPSSGCSASSATPSSVEGLGVEAEADWDHLRTPETYLGYLRGERSRPRRRRVRRAPRVRAPRPSALEPMGPRRRVDDRAREGRARQAGGSIAFRFHARDAHLVLSPGARRADPLPRAPRRRGSRPVPRRRRRRGRQRRLRDGRLYQLVRQPDPVRERTLEITFLEPGAEAYAFTFG